MIEVLKQALEALEIAAEGGGVNFYAYAEELRQAIAELESQEPVAWMHPDWPDGYSGFQSPVSTYMTNGWIPLYTTPPQLEQNFCPRCGKRTNDIHTCTPPHHTWIGLTNEELTDLFYNTNLGQQSAVSQAIALLKERNS